MSGALMAAAICSFMIMSMAAPASQANADDLTRQRNDMVVRQIMSRGVKDSRVLEAMRKVPRHLFVPERERPYAYDDSPLPIGEGQTISQPYIVAYMTEALGLKRTDKVLEIGTGSGYQAAVLSEIVDHVYTIEIIASLADRAKKTLASLGYHNVKVRHGDGYRGWPEEAPFDAIIVTCAPDQIPAELKEQLAEGGTMVIPVGRAGSVQTLVRAIKKEGRIHITEEMAVRFVPMVKEKR